MKTIRSQFREFYQDNEKENHIHTQIDKSKKGQDKKWQLCRISTIINCLLLVVVIVNTFNKIYMNIEILYVTYRFKLSAWRTDKYQTKTVEHR